MALTDLMKFVKSIDMDKVRTGFTAVQTGVQMASSAIETPEIALAGLLKTFANRAMGVSLENDEAKMLASMVVKTINKRKPR